MTYGIIGGPENGDIPHIHQFWSLSAMSRGEIPSNSEFSAGTYSQSCFDSTTEGNGYFHSKPLRSPLFIFSTSSSESKSTSGYVAALARRIRSTPLSCGWQL
jgi:hypothetical protein